MLQNIGLSRKCFLDMTPKAKMDKWDYFKLKDVHTVKDSIE